MLHRLLAHARPVAALVTVLILAFAAAPHEAHAAALHAPALAAPAADGDIVGIITDIFRLIGDLLSFVASILNFVASLVD
jgi:hypothetical protein